MYELKKIKPCVYLLEKTQDMKVPGLIITTENLLKNIERPLEQVRNVASLPGIIGYSIAMPDIHWGYGFPIGGVAAMDVETGVISPGGVGYDINCGVRLALVPIEYKSLSEKIKKDLLKEIFFSVPSGLGSSRKKDKELSLEDYKNIAEKGMHWAVENGYGFLKDIEHTESKGCIPANIQEVSSLAKDRGKKQIGSIGSGNHFIEIGVIDSVDNKEVADDWGVKKGFIYVLIHSGSRGFGHQVCQDALKEFVKKGYAEDVKDKQLVAAPIKSSLGKKYINNMSVAANFAFNNRQKILHHIREAFQKICSVSEESIKQLYDVCHNIAKFEEYEIEGKKKILCVHRKGATRAFGKNNKELVKIFQKTGQPVLVPGDMGRCSYLMVGLGNQLTWCSTCHGAGREKSRVQSLKKWKGKDLISFMKNKGIDVMAASKETIAEEMPDSYKDVEEVVLACREAKLANIVSRLKPKLVIKG